MSNEETIKFYKRKLPHWIVANKSYFVTIRLKNSLPKKLMEKLKKQREEINAVTTDSKELLNLKRAQFRQIESALDYGKTGKTDLLNQKVTQVVFESLNWLKSKGWFIYGATIMSNHVHLLMSNANGRTEALLNDLGQFKNFTAREANKILLKKGHFWAREDFDHWIRSNGKFERVVNYIAMNPVKAHYVQKWDEWKWTMIDDSVKDCIKGN